MKISIFIISTLLMFLTGFAAIAANQSQREKKCNAQTERQLQMVESPFAKWSERLPGAKIYGRFSPDIDGCLAMIEAKIQNVWFIFDLENKLMEQFYPLFYCDEDGIDNIIIPVAKKFRGKLATTSFFKYMDDGDGGPPRVINTPIKPYTPKMCETTFRRRVQALIK